MPAIRAEKRPNLSGWTIYQRVFPTAQNIANWFDKPQSGCCIVGGAISGNLECMDFDQAGLAFGPWGNKVREAAPGLFERLTIEQSPSGGYHVLYRCPGIELPTNAKWAYDAAHKILIEQRGEAGIFLCTPTAGYELRQGSFETIPTLTPEERDILINTARSFNVERKKPTPKVHYNHLGLPVSEPEDIPRRNDAEAEGRPGDVFNQTGDIRALLEKHGWTLVNSNGDEERWCRPGKTFGTSATLKEIDGKICFYVFSSNAQPLESDRCYDGFGLYAALETGGDITRASEQLAALGFGERYYHEDLPEIDVANFKINGVLAFEASPLPEPVPSSNTSLVAFQNRRDPETFEPFPLHCLPPHTRQYIIEKTESMNLNAAGFACALLTQAGAHLGAAVKLKLGNDYWTPPILWMAYMGISGMGKSPAIDAIRGLIKNKEKQIFNVWKQEQSFYLSAMKAYEKERKKNSDAIPPTAPILKQPIVTDATYEGLIQAVMDSGSRTMILLDELVSWFNMTNRTGIAGEANKWLTGYSGGTITTVRASKRNIFVQDAYWAICGGSTPEQFRSFISANGRDKDGTLSRFNLIWPPDNLEYRESDVELKSIEIMRTIMETLVDFEPSEGRQYEPLYMDENTDQAWREWKKSIFYAKRNCNTDLEASYISKTQDLLPRIAIILHALDAAEQLIDSGKKPERTVEKRNGITYSNPMPLRLILSPNITIEEWNAAVEITNWIRSETMACYRHLMLIKTQTSDESINRLLDILRNAGDAGVTVRDIGQKIKRFRYSSNGGQQELENILNGMIDQGIVVKKISTSKNNKQVENYILTNVGQRAQRKGALTVEND